MRFRTRSHLFRLMIAPELCGVLLLSAIIFLALFPGKVIAQTADLRRTEPLMTLGAFQEEPPDMDPEAAARDIENERKAKRLLRGLPEEPTPEEEEEQRRAAQLGIPYEKYHEAVLREKAAEEHIKKLTESARSADILELVRSGELDEIVDIADFGSFPRRELLANAYAASKRFYKVYGTRLDGGVDEAYVSGRALLLKYKTSVLSALPDAPDEYRSVEVDFWPDNTGLLSRLLSPSSRVNRDWPKQNPIKRLLQSGEIAFPHPSDILEEIPINERQPKYVHVTSNQPELFSSSGRTRWTRDPQTAKWRLSKTRPFPQLANIRGDRLPLRTLRVTRNDDEWTRISLYPRTSAGGMQTWLVATDDPGAEQEIVRAINNTQMIVHIGDDLPLEQQKHLFISNPESYVRRSDRSANISEQQIKDAAKLGNRPLQTTNLKILNALPQESGWLASRTELWRMRLDFGQRDAWQQLQASVSAVANSLNVGLIPASKAGLLSELSAGSSDVVFIVAHSEGPVVYLPGKNGGPFSIHGLEGIKRKIAPNRIVVLITCEGGRANEDTASFAEVILQNKLARAVFASPSLLDARILPDFLKSIVSSQNPIRETLQKHGLMQLVSELWQRATAA